MRFFVASLFFLACIGSGVSAHGSKPPLWPFYRTYAWPPLQGVFVVVRQYRVFGRTTRLSHGHDSTPIRKQNNPNKIKKFWGWVYKDSYVIYNRQGKRLNSTHYGFAGSSPDHRIIVGRKKNDKKYCYIDSVGITTPFSKSRR